MLKPFLRTLAGFLLPALLGFAVSGFGVSYLTWAVVILGYLISIFVFRASILMFVGARVYSANAKRGLKVLALAYKTGKLKPELQLIYAYTLLRNGYVDEAETIINKATVIGKQSLSEKELMGADFNRALIVWKKGDLSGAIVKLEELYEKDYKTPAFLGSLSSLYLLNKEFDKALEIAKEGTQLSTTDFVSQDNMGQAYIELGMMDEALELYKKLIPCGPKFLEAYYNYATVLEKRGSLEKARRYYGIALTFEEKFFSIVTHDMVCEAIERVDALMI